jgi:hypothetical protein
MTCESLAVSPNDARKITFADLPIQRVGHIPVRSIVSSALEKDQGEHPKMKKGLTAQVVFPHRLHWTARHASRGTVTVKSILNDRSVVGIDLHSIRTSCRVSTRLRLKVETRSSLKISISHPIVLRSAEDGGDWVNWLPPLYMSLPASRAMLVSN